MEITRIYRGKRSNRINIDIDLDFAFSVEENTLAKFNLYKGLEVTDKLWQEIVEYDIVEFAFSKALEYLSSRVRSRLEIERYVVKVIEKKRQSTPELVEKVVKKLEGLGFVNDTDYARAFVRTKLATGNKSAREIQTLLFQKGIDKNVSEEIIKENYPAETREEVIKGLIEKKLESSKIKNLGKEEQKRKITEYLLRKGFKYDIIKKVLYFYF